MTTTLEAPTPRRRSQDAHIRAVSTDITAAVKSLIETLGKGLVAVIVERDVKTVARWAEGTTPRDIDEERRLLDTLQICELLLTGDSPSVVRSWFMGMNPQLNDKNPAEVLAEGRTRDVMAAARAYVNAG